MNRRKLIQLIGTTSVLGMIGFAGRREEMLHTIDTRMQDEINNKTITNKKVQMKTIGVLGGIGPQATMNFENMIHEASRQLIPPLYNSGYPPMVVYYHRYAPVLIKEDLTPVLPLQPDPHLLEGAKNLGAVADFLVITSNGVHGMQKEIEAAAGKKVLSMIDVTLEEVTQRKWKKVAVIGYRNATVYTSRLKEMGVVSEVISDELQHKLDLTVMKVMEGNNTVADHSLIKEIIAVLRMQKVDGIILGCTELPLLLQEDNSNDLLNPAKLLAMAAVKYSLQ